MGEPEEDESSPDLTKTIFDFREKYKKDLKKKGFGWNLGVQTIGWSGGLGGLLGGVVTGAMTLTGHAFNGHVYGFFCGMFALLPWLWHCMNLNRNVVGKHRHQALLVATGIFYAGAVFFGGGLIHQAMHENLLITDAVLATCVIFSILTVISVILAVFPYSRRRDGAGCSPPPAAGRFA